MMAQLVRVSPSSPCRVECPVVNPRSDLRLFKFISPPTVLVFPYLRWRSIPVNCNFISLSISKCSKNFNILAATVVNNCSFDPVDTVFDFSTLDLRSKRIRGNKA